MKIISYLSIILALLFLSSCTKDKDADMRGTGSDTISTRTDKTKVDDARDSAGHMGGMMDFNRPMQMMMDNMHKMQFSNNPDYDFATMMKHHHEAGVEMASTYIANAKNEDLKKMAQEMINNQQKEISELEQWIQKQNKPTAPASGLYKDAIDKSMNSMMSKMNMRMSGDADKDFAEMMSGHHKDAIDMANTEIKFGKDSEIKKMAEKMKDEQEKDVKELEKWLSENK